ncbi:methyltransferase domain-containing protein [Proteiniclasticum sp. BAD-10]|uniref:Methyltransferase domain-containing protein n=1 Tax=Proteiniclasticum sediminis TaxID=2804028 RepID=A0A941HPS0_9CLOT|nr:methyltransferase domain-containing protein [Proteiniclasticum sediminis]MBR0575639.1 methyltransferase domain-containing protein [Proteiniclasticum sediminis]
MKKIEEKISLMAKDPVLSCPRCRKPLEVSGKSLVCATGHTYDVSKKGTVNFVQGEGEDDYNMAMLEARERVIAQGFFDGILRRVAEAVARDLMAKGQQTARILDAGCGDGSQLVRLGLFLKEKGFSVSLYGVDISKDGISIAGRRAGDALYFVGDLSRLPFLEGTMDIILNILSPANYKEFARVLKKDGLAYKVIPDTGYLTELRKLYGLPEYSNGEIVRHLEAHAVIKDSEKIRYVTDVTAYADDLLLMTPMLWDKPMADSEGELHHMTVETELYTFGF